MDDSLRPRIRRAAAVSISLLLFAATAIEAQTGTITGRVTDANSGQPLSAIQVSIPALGLGTLSQQNGRYLLVNVPAGTHALSVVRIGYQTSTGEVTVGAGQTVVRDFVMEEQALQLDEVIVTGTAGGTQRRALGNTVTRVEVGDITERVFRALEPSRHRGMDHHGFNLALSGGTRGVARP